jgi:Short C-terminal domain
VDVFGNKKKRAANLMENGSLAVGTITNVRDTGVTINEINIRVALTFKIEPLDGSAPFEAHKKTNVPRTSIPQVGQRFPVWYSPEDQTEFAYATSDGGEQARQQIVQLFGDRFGPDGSGVGVAAAPAAATPAAPTPVDPVERLQKLEQLRVSGVLTDAEFAEQKQKILAEM